MTGTQATKNTIRRDIYAVKVWDSFLDDWCFESMSYNRKTALAHKRDADRRTSTLGFVQKSKLVHPARWVVDGYLAAGNTIWP